LAGKPSYVRQVALSLLAAAAIVALVVAAVTAAIGPGLDAKELREQERQREEREEERQELEEERQELEQERQESERERLEELQLPTQTSARMRRASAGEATSRPSSPASRTTRSTSWALLVASSPLR
jgi:flagellar biosynthesis/type III secretory pathway M-ring protein FliF/YscJ